MKIARGHHPSMRTSAAVNDIAPATDPPWVTSAQFSRGEPMSNVPADLKYTKTHEWVRIDGDVATVGISDYAQSELGDIVYVDLPSVGRSLAVGDSFGSVESVKTVSDVYAPLSGEVIEVNESLGALSE